MYARHDRWPIHGKFAQRISRAITCSTDNYTPAGLIWVETFGLLAPGFAGIAHEDGFGVNTHGPPAGAAAAAALPVGQS